MNDMLQALEVEGIEYKTNINLSDFTYLKTGGIVKLMIFPKTTEEVVFLVKYFAKFNVNYKVIGATSNLMFLDNTTYSCLLSTSKLNQIELNLNKNKIISGSGLMMTDLSRFSLNNSIKGFEGFEGIPGTVGGAVFMNAGAYSYEIKDVLDSIEIIDKNGFKNIIRVEDLGLRYRNSYLRDGIIKGIVTKCFFNIKFGVQYEIENKMELFHAKRHKYQEFLYPNLGSLYSGLIYKELGKRDSFFRMIYFFYTFINYKIKIFRRESPINRKWINDIIVKRFNIKYDIQPFSNKTINCLVNRGQGTGEMIRFITQIKDLTNNKVPVENEIVDKF